MHAELLVNWFALDSEMRVLARGVVTVGHIGEGKLAPVSDFGKVEVEQDGVLVHALYQYDGPQTYAQGGSLCNGVLLTLPSPVPLAYGNRLSFTWNHSFLWQMNLEDIPRLLEAPHAHV